MERSTKSRSGINDTELLNRSKEQEFKHTNPGTVILTQTNEIPCALPKKEEEIKRKKHFKTPTCVQKPNKEQFTSYLKKKFLKVFSEQGFTPESLSLCLNTSNVDEDKVKEYYCIAAKEAQQYVYQECDSLSFSNINEWLRYLQSKGAAEKCNYEAAIVMNAISNNESLPEPEVMGGINLKSIYKYLSNALMGLPLPALDPASAKFLSNEFKNLINVANTDKADIDVHNMKTILEVKLSTTENLNPSSLDPLNIKEVNELVVNSTEKVLLHANHVKTED